MKKNNLISKVIYIFDNKKIQFFYFLILFIISSFVELIGLGLIIPFIILITQSQSNLENYEFLNFSISFNQQSLTLSIIAFLTIKYLLMIYTNYSIPKFAYDHQKDLRIRIIKNFIFQKVISNSNELVQLVSGTLQIFTSQFIISILKVSSSVLILLFIATYLIFFDVKITLFLLVLFIIIFLFYNYYLKSRFKFFGKVVIGSSEDIILNTSQIFKGIQEIIIYQKSKLFIDKIKKNSSELSRAETSTRFMITLPRFFMEIIILFSLFFIILLYPNQAVNENSILSIGVFGFAGIRIIPSLTDLIAHLNNIKFSTKTVDTIYNSLKKESNLLIKENENFKEKFQSIKIKNLDFRYPKNKFKIIDKLSFEIKQGETIGVIGPSGTGKSTLVKIILGFIKPTKGEILYNNTNEKIQNISSYIPQEIFILRGTVRENVTLTNIKNKKIDNQIWSSLKRSGLYDFIKSKKEKLNFNIGDDGKNLSGGQKQRIAIARAIFHQKEIIVLDEATSSLDIKKENKILYDLQKNKTLTKIIISHKKNIKNYCDKVIEFKNESKK